MTKRKSSTQSTNNFDEFITRFLPLSDKKRAREHDGSAFRIGERTTQETNALISLKSSLAKLSH